MQALVNGEWLDVETIEIGWKKTCDIPQLPNNKYYAYAKAKLEDNLTYRWKFIGPVNIFGRDDQGNGISNPLTFHLLTPPSVITPIPAVSPYPAQREVPGETFTVSAPKAYPKPVGALNVAEMQPIQSFEIPVSIQAPPSGTNVKLWIYNPDNQKISLESPSVHFKPANGEWKMYAVNSDGSFYANFPATRYEILVTPPNNSKYKNTWYIGDISDSGIFSIRGKKENSSGYFTLTVDRQPLPNPKIDDLRQKLTTLANTPVSSFKPKTSCQLLDQVRPNRNVYDQIAAGFPKSLSTLPSFGHLRALIIPVDFTDFAGIDDPLPYFTPVAEGVSVFYNTQSYGQLAFDFDVIPQWVHLPFASRDFYGNHITYLKNLIKLTDGPIDYSSYDAVYYLIPKEVPSEIMPAGPAISSLDFSNNVIMIGALGGKDMYDLEGGIVGARWKWMAHETGHGFGFFDEDLNHASQSLGFWGIMAMSWSNNAIELGAWDRYIQGWLAQSQVNCISLSDLNSEGLISKISPVVRQDKEVKSIMVPLSASKILVIESRKNEGLDIIPADHEGVLIYTVDMTKGQLGGGYETQRRIGTTNPTFEDAALHAGDSITVEGVKIEVLALDISGDTIKISKP